MFSPAPMLCNLAVWATALLSAWQPLGALHCTCPRCACGQVGDGTSHDAAARKVANPKRRCRCCRSAAVRSEAKRTTTLVLRALLGSPCRCPITCECHRQHVPQPRPLGTERCQAPTDLDVISHVSVATAASMSAPLLLRPAETGPPVALGASATCIALCRFTL